MKSAFLAALPLFLAAGSRPDDRDRWLPPVKSVTLERADRTVGETLQSLREQTGLDIRASGLEESTKLSLGWKSRPVLEALHDLCRALGAGSVKVSPGGQGKESIELDGRGKPSAWACHWRQFRVEFTDASVTTTRSLEATKRTASLSLSWMGQPGTHPLSVEGFQADEVVDDTGWSLVMKEAGIHRRLSDDPMVEGEDPNAVIPVSRFHDHDSSENVQLYIRAPAPEAKTIARLRGRLFMTFPMRYVEQSIPAAEIVAGKKIEIGSITIEVVKFEQRGEKLTFAYKMSRRGGMRDYFTFTDFEILDEKDAPVSRGSSGSGSGEGYTVEYSLASPAPVAKVHHKAYLGRITLAIPVDLQALPLPEREP
jgi:hypothetical protein